MPSLFADNTFRLVYYSKFPTQQFAGIHSFTTLHCCSSIPPIWRQQLLWTELRHCHRNYKETQSI